MEIRYMPSTFLVPAANSGMACASGGPPMTGMVSPAPLRAFIIASACGAVIMRARASALALSQAATILEATPLKSVWSSGHWSLSLVKVMPWAGAISPT